jgi:hypothetical protein
MAKPAMPDTTQLMDVVQILSRRLDWLEKSLLAEEDEIEQRDVRLAQRESDWSHSMREIQEGIRDLRSDLRSLDEMFVRLSSALKTAVKQEDIARLTALIDRIELGSMLTHRALARELEDALLTSAHEPRVLCVGGVMCGGCDAWLERGLTFSTRKYFYTSPCRFSKQFRIML